MNKKRKYTILNTELVDNPLHMFVGYIMLDKKQVKIIGDMLRIYCKYKLTLNEETNKEF